MIVAAGVVAIVFEVAVVPAAVRQNPQTPAFRSVTSAVRVEVAVRDRWRQPVQGLTAADFAVTDNGVPQEVSDVSFDVLPIDVTIGLDVSRSVTGPLLDRLRQAVLALMRDLRREDRLKLMLFNMRVAKTIDFTADLVEVERAIREASAGGGTALFDALSLAIVSAADPDRRQLVVFFSDGQDAVSVTEPAVLMKVAERTRASVSLVLLPTRTVTAAEQAAGLKARSQVTVIPALIDRLVRETGGTWTSTTVLTDISPVFLQTVRDFRTAYVLHFTPRGVASEGFHTLDVKVARPDVIVQARRGYFGG
jgi:VWFA-related protein